MSTRDHKRHSPAAVSVAIISVSTTRRIETDKSGDWIRRRAAREGHRVVLHAVRPDDRTVIAATVHEVISEHRPDVILLSGGTGITGKDVTIEAVQPLFEKQLSAFGALFAQLSFEQIDAAAILSRATAGIIGSTVVFCMPGSLNACKLACKALIFPELGHLVKHVRE